jgi:hypothetical protein
MKPEQLDNVVTNILEFLQNAYLHDFPSAVENFRLKQPNLWDNKNFRQSLVGFGTILDSFTPKNTRTPEFFTEIGIIIRHYHNNDQPNKLNPLPETSHVPNEITKMAAAGFGRVLSKTD